MLKKVFEEPAYEIVKLAVEDVITASGNGDDGWIPGDNWELPNV